MGTGTGILAVLAEKLGASEVIAPDIDEWSYNNARENVALNGCEKITVLHGGIASVKNSNVDILIANINKNILIEHFPTYSTILIKGGTMLISGFFVTDKEDLVMEANKHGFVFEEMYQKDEWALLQFVKL
jgi:ribosomal protein L11 methyltransferase